MPCPSMLLLSRPRPGIYASVMTRVQCQSALIDGRTGCDQGPGELINHRLHRRARLKRCRRTADPLSAVGDLEIGGGRGPEAERPEQGAKREGHGTKILSLRRRVCGFRANRPPPAATSARSASRMFQSFLYSFQFSALFEISADKPKALASCSERSASAYAAGSSRPLASSHRRCSCRGLRGLSLPAQARALLDHAAGARFRSLRVQSQAGAFDRHERRSRNASQQHRRQACFLKHSGALGRAAQPVAPRAHQCRLRRRGPIITRVAKTFTTCASAPSRQPSSAAQRTSSQRKAAASGQLYERSKRSAASAA